MLKGSTFLIELYSSYFILLKVLGNSDDDGLSFVFEYLIRDVKSRISKEIKFNIASLF